MGKEGFPLRSVPSPAADKADHTGGGLASPGELQLHGSGAGPWEEGGEPSPVPSSSCVRRRGVGTQLSLPLKTRLARLCPGRGRCGLREPALGHSPHAERTRAPELPKRPSSCSCDAGTLRRHLLPSWASPAISDWRGLFTAKGVSAARLILLPPQSPVLVGTHPDGRGEPDCPGAGVGGTSTGQAPRAELSTRDQAGSLAGWVPAPEIFRPPNRQAGPRQGWSAPGSIPGPCHLRVAETTPHTCAHSNLGCRQPGLCPD